MQKGGLLGSTQEVPPAKRAFEQRRIVDQALENERDGALIAVGKEIEEDVERCTTVARQGDGPSAGLDVATQSLAAFRPVAMENACEKKGEGGGGERE